MLLLLSALLPTACGRPGGYGYTEYGAPPYNAGGESASLAPSHYYPPPGPPDDPWGPYIREAAGRYSVPEQWVRAVMQQESGGQEQAVSPVGAMGLMQVMPGTYEGLRARYGLGDDPYDPHNNILAGTAYIREMYDRFGAPGFLAAYNAGPDRVDSYLAGAGELPDETVNYLAAVTPNLGDAVPLSGPLSRYAAARPAGSVGYSPSAASLAAGCDLSAAYDPNHPCTSLMRAASAPAPFQTAFVPQTGANGCDLSAAYDPSHPCTSAGTVVASAAAPAPVAAAPQPAAVQVAAAAAPVQTAFAQQSAANGCDLSAAYDPSHPCTSAGTVAASAAAPATPAAAPPQRAPVQMAAAGGCDIGAAYNSNDPCSSAGPVATAPPAAITAPAPLAQPIQPAIPSAQPRLQLASAEGCDPTGAFDPDRPCNPATSSAPPAAAEPAYLAPAITGSRTAAPSPPPGRPVATAFAATGAHVLALPNRDWAIQVGAFANPRLARAVAEGARAEAPDQLRAATLALPPTPSGGSLLYRARLAHLSASAASDACWRLNQRQLPCVVVQPSRS
ncbi:MAG TPA: lytic transglycosylase domain-containing protein [Stellaceae bacterium]|nr:lytic transglycosylase domain-containing protein [Stellaceae bacterium]